MDKKFNSVSDLLKDMGIDKDIVKRVDKEIEDHSLGKKLTILRMKNNLSQAEMAKKIGVSQPCISRLEYASNDQIKLGDLNKYVAALGYETTLVISKPQKIKQKIKNKHIFYKNIPKNRVFPPKKCVTNEDKLKTFPLTKKP